MIKLRNPLKAQLKIAYLVVTYACNNKCNFCYAQSMLKKFIEGEELVHMPLEFAYQIVSELKSLGVNRFHLIGGEPTVYPYLLDLVRFIKQDPRVYVAIVTNGRKIGDEAYLKDLVDAGVNGFQISIQGADAERHNAVTGSYSFDMTYKALLNLAKLNFPQFSAAITVSKDNCDQIEGFIHTMKKEIFNGGHSGKIFINFAAPSINFNSSTSVNGEYALNPREVVDLILKIDSLFPAELYSEIIFSSRVPICMYPSGSLERLNKNNRMSAGCSCGLHNGNIITIDPRGDVLPCTNFAGTRLFNCRGENNVFDKDSFINGINRYFPKIKELAHSYPSIKCKGCSKIHRCFGACLFWWFYFNPDHFIKP
ncbi:hypothetical protein CVU82_00840 [Candidatus Falkowbacteria bacterium HGW-Falkowbacteria-1]|uniref:Radical SAM core domain-containing protein n=1 Tax=Candidatus Falkowbacteria bacterium HGW-Falkowbacteria-1 TaxID=2013768 RepID=A0A2N2EAI8_9BACT|nr:MAG: hypothetical protein CVU82_00840 [Candidatus Falkowbacteria bacterium HGW-Falkowbacteria-1]